MPRGTSAAPPGPRRSRERGRGPPPGRARGPARRARCAGSPGPARRRRTLRERKKPQGPGSRAVARRQIYPRGLGTPVRSGCGSTLVIRVSQSGEIVVSGAREHNLKDLHLRLPRNALIVITGLSGSGKSSLAFDTIYAEGQRRYVESLSAYARQFLGQMDKPDVDSIEGLSPAISIDQKTTSRNPRSTVGTVTEIYDYLRLLWARVGHPYCFNCGEEITAQTVQQMVDAIRALPEGVKFQVLAPIVRGRKGEYRKELLEMRRA